MKALVSYETELAKLNTYRDWMKFLQGAADATDQMLGFAFHGATQAAEAEGIEADFSSLKLLGKKVSDSQVNSAIAFYEKSELYGKLQAKYPQLTAELPSKHSTYDRVQGDTVIDKAEMFDEITKAYIKDIVDGKITTVNTAESKGNMSANSSRILISKLKVILNQKANGSNIQELDVTIEPPKEYVKAYQTNKKQAYKALGVKVKPKLKNVGPRTNYTTYEWDFVGSELPPCKDVEFRDYLESLGLSRETAQEVNYAGLAGMDQGIIKQLSDVSDAWKKSRAKMMKCAHPDTGGEPEAIQVFNVVNVIMKDIIAAKDEATREELRWDAEKTFRAELFKNASALVEEGKFKSTYEYNNHLTKGECDE